MMMMMVEVGMMMTMIKKNLELIIEMLKGNGLCRQVVMVMMMMILMSMAMVIIMMTMMMMIY